MRKRRDISIEEKTFLVAPPARDESLDLPAVFGRAACLEVDLGCGDGSFLAQGAASAPDRDFLGIEQMAGRVRSACRRAAEGKLCNARILSSDLTAAVHFLPAESVSIFHLLFPDPWPKRRHHRRRIFTEEWLDGIARTLAPGGVFRIATDHRDYFDWMRRALSQARSLQECEPDDLDTMPVSTFEKHFLERGIEIHRLVLRKTSEPR